MAQFYDLDLVDDHYRHCSDAFGPTFLHCVAIKSNSLSRMLRYTYDVHGFGIECASMGEVLHAMNHCKIPKSHIVFDSPCKTLKELEFCIMEKIHCNLDNFTEF